MNHRKLRIACSAFCGLAVLLFIALWVRSAWRFDSIGWYSASDHYYSLFSQRGHITFLSGYNPNAGIRGATFALNHVALVPFVDSSSEPTMSNYFGVRWYSSHGTQAFRETILATPHWLAAVLAASCGVLPWLGVRFSLRTLLIATTQVAVVLGLVAYKVQ